MDYTELAKSVVTQVGYKKNVVSITNCVTRLRFELKDESIVNDQSVKDIEGVMGVVRQGGQYQVIVGPHVSSVAEAVKKELGFQEDDGDVETTSSGNGDENLFNRMFKAIAATIFPFMGLLVASGITRGLLNLLVALGWITSDGGFYVLLYGGADAIMYFLPILVGYSAGKKFGANPFITAAVGAALVYPEIVSLTNEGTELTFLSIPIVLTSYGNTLFPVLLASFFTAKLQKFWERIIPDMIKNMVVPFLTMNIIIPATFLLIGPAMNILSDILAGGTQFLWNLSPILAGVLLGAFWQLIVIFGLHYAFIPILINNIVTMGQDPMNAVLGMTVWALAGAALGFAFKRTDKKEKANGISCFITGLFGITEPIIYTIALPHKKPFLAAFVGGGIAGGLLASSGAAMQGFANGGFFQTFMMIKPDEPMNLIWFFVASVVSFVVSLVLSYILVPKTDQKLQTETNL